jgi:5-oxoprolinase (ATP-hydrolysing) subunit A
MLMIDLNADVGEGFPFDEQLMPWLTSVNIACGYHAGDLPTMRHVSAIAHGFGLAIGAHVGFDDRTNFGRIALNLSPELIYDLVTEQILILRDVTQDHGYALSHVKPHGALYNLAARDPAIAQVVAQAVRDTDPDLMLYGLSGSELIGQGKTMGLGTVSEVFADRSYQDDASLTARSLPSALIEDPAQSIRQVLGMILHGRTLSVTGKWIDVSAQTICIHGDSPQSPSLVQAIHQALSEAGICICRP